MTKTEFLKKLSRELSALKRDERKKSLSYYDEFIDDGVESGLTEDQAIAQMESVAIIAEGIISDASARGALKPKRKPLPIVLIILGSPLWISLGGALGAVFLAVCVSVGAVILSIYVVLWAVILSLFVAVLSLIASGFMGIFAFFVHVFSYPATAFMFFGAGLISIAVGVIFYFPIFQLAKWLVQGTVSAWKHMWSRILKRRAK